jgi:hypothetical protein
MNRFILVEAPKFGGRTLASGELNGPLPDVIEWRGRNFVPTDVTVYGTVYTTASTWTLVDSDLRVAV